jgi:hypothetical protein
MVFPWADKMDGDWVASKVGWLVAVQVEKWVFEKASRAVAC